MTDLSLHIEQLLRHYDSVALPGFGAFLAEYNPARVVASTGEIMPPERLVTFNSRVTLDDDRLVCSMMRRHHYSRTVAVEAVNAAVDAVRGAVAVCGRCQFGRLGEFRSDATGTLTFVPAATMPLSVNPYGLLSAVPVTSVLAAARTEAGIASGTPSENAVAAAPIFLPSQQSRRYWGRIAAMLAIVATFGIAFLNSDTDRGHTRPSLAAIASYTGSSQAKPLDCELYIAYPDPEEATATVQPAVPEHRDGSGTTTAAAAGPVDTNRRVYGLGSNVTTKGAAATNGNTPVNPAKASAGKSVAPATSSSTGGKYALIIASLPSREEARRFIAKDGNPNLEIIEADGRYRVAISRSDSRATLEQQQPNVASQYKGAWIYAGK
ncbi:MAG: hypothetical protein NC187_09165 [Candidatus Amulumruptor caecigallinarius]|nr:hypothetical protein [Candidatus Amulumruptor caecigallinarius]